MAEFQRAWSGLGQRARNTSSTLDSSTNRDTATAIDLYDIISRVAKSECHILSTPPIRGASVNEFEPSLARIVFATPFKVTPVRVRVPAVPELSPMEIDLFVVDR